MRNQLWYLRRSLVALVILLLVMPCLSACTAAEVSSGTTNLTKTCYNGKCLTYATWGKNIDAAINGKAVGYAYVILHNGVVTAQNAFGQARTAADPPATTMTAEEPFQIASVSKTITAVAVMHLLAAKQISVKSSIAPYLPPSWPLGQGVDQITFAELLTHTSGFLGAGVVPGDNRFTYAQLKDLLSQDINTNYKAGCKLAYALRMFVTCYQNANFSLFRIIIPYLLGSANPIPPASLDSLLSFSPDLYDTGLASATAQDYLSYMNSVYGPSHELPISCTPQGSSRMLSYLNPGGGTGTDWGDWGLMCGAGGIQLSVNQMAGFLSNLTSGDYLPVAASSNPDALTLPAMVKNMYGWDVPFLGTATYGTCVQKNGGLGHGFIPATSTTPAQPATPVVTTLIVYCPQTGLEFAGLANSLLWNGNTYTTWDGIVGPAYTASWQ
jgi:CubicO group peptidase (beta-lactamase class C family)